MGETFVTTALRKPTAGPVMNGLASALNRLSIKSIDIDMAWTLPSTASLIVLVNRPAHLSIVSSQSKVRIIPYIFDFWPTRRDWFIDELSRLGPDPIFLSNRWAAGEVAREFSDRPVIYLPEGVDTAAYLNREPLAARSVDVLEYGRRHDGWHTSIASEVAIRGYNHRYSGPSNNVGHNYQLFQNHEDLIRGLWDARISICFPASMTHPLGRSRGVEALTARYLESIAAGCLVLGHGPEELRALFDFQPAISVDWDRPAQQLIEILRNYSEFQQHVNQCTSRILEVGDWNHRTGIIMAHI